MKTRLLMTLGDIASHLPQEEQLPFLGNALDTVAGLEKPELADVLLPTMHQWFPDFGYETDQSYVPAVLESLGESEHMNRKGTYMFGKAAHRVTTMGGTDARAELRKDLESLKLEDKAAFHDRGLSLQIPRMTVINKEEAFGFGAFGTAASLALAAISPVAAGIVWAGWSATALAASNYKVDKTKVMKSHNPGSSLYPGPANYPKK